jgi:hypothetical protein
MLAVVTTLVLVTPVSAPGQDRTVAKLNWTPPRTADGQPDLQGVWANNTATPLERPEALAGKEALTDEELAELKAKAAQVLEGNGDAIFGDRLVEGALANVTGATSSDTGTGNYNHFWLVERDFDNRTSLVVDPSDGRIPSLTPQAETSRTERAAYRRDHPADSWQDRDNSDRCFTYGAPRLSAGYNSYFQILQTAEQVVILQEMIHEARIIPIDGRPHLDEGIRQVLGDSRAHWEADTLVIETTNFSPQSDFRGSGENLHVVERFTRVGPDTLNWEVTVDDNTMWTSPWTTMIPLRQSEDAMFEYACHEGNYAMEGILSGHRAQEAAEKNPR